MNRQHYSTDLTDAEWSHLAPHMPPPKAGDRRRLHPVREILNAIFYIVRSGCAWRSLPHDLPPWKTVYHYFRLWRSQGLMIIIGLLGLMFYLQRRKRVISESLSAQPLDDLVSPRHTLQTR